MKYVTAILIACLMSTGAYAKGSINGDWNKCKQRALCERPDSVVKVKKIRGRSIDMSVKTPDGELLILKCFRNDYTLVTKKGK